jgi:hypothetical protein
MLGGAYEELESIEARGSDTRNLRVPELDSAFSFIVRDHRRRVFHFPFATAIGADLNVFGLVEKQTCFVRANRP